MSRSDPNELCGQLRQINLYINIVNLFKQKDTMYNTTTLFYFISFQHTLKRYK